MCLCKLNALFRNGAKMKLHDHLQEQGISLKEFAARTGVTEMAVRYWVSGKRIPGPDIMRRIMALTDGQVQANDFFDIPEAAAHNGDAA